MDQLNNYDYYVTRVESARKLAQNAKNASIAAIHSEMASRYEDTITQIVQSMRQAGEEVQAA